MTSSKRKVSTSDEGHADLAPPPRSRPRLISSSESSTQLFPISIMEGVEPSHSETPTSVERLQGAPNDNLKFDHDDYTVAWICPLEVEEIAALKMLDVRHQPLSQPENDHNAYTLGSINGHNVVIASLPISGNNHAATVVTQTRNTFRHVRFGLLVGIGGGVPTVTETGPVRLGHVVVSKPTGTHSGAVQYVHGKVEHHEREGVAFKRTGFLAPPPTVLLGAARKLNIARTMADSDPVLDHLKRIDTSKPRFRRFKCPGIDNDHLYKPEYVHLDRKVSCRKCGCDLQQRVNRCSDDSDDEFEEMDPSENVVVHEGTIASGEWVIKNGLQRDEWAEKEDILCFEMEAAGALADFSCLVIRGISDYADSHKNDRWHGFAAAVAAAYARELFFHMPVAEVKKLGMTEADVKIMVTETKSLVQSKLDSDIKAWLSPPDPSTNYNAASAKHLDGTGSWFIKSKEFLSWRTTPGPSALWLYGSPGCGKTILTYAVLQELRNAIDRSIPKGTIMYYFFDFNDAEKQSPDNMVRSLMFQLSRQCESAGSHLKGLFQKHKTDDSKPSIQSLCTTFQAMLNESGDPIIILDALDECATRHDTSGFGGQRLLGWLGQLQCRILMTSRREEDIESCIDTWKTKTILSMQESPVDEDIRAYVQQYLRSPGTNELAKTWQANPAVLNHIESKILEKAAGMFRWVACQLDALADHRMRHRLFAALESLPPTLTETYRRILQGIPEIHQEDTARLLQFLVYAKRPLTIEEATDVLAVIPESKPPFDKENRPPQILKYCSNLATISNDDKVHLAHFSVKEYLISGEDKGLFTKPLMKSEAESSITEVSLAYISCLTGVCDIGPYSGTNEWSPQEIKDRYPLAMYCALHWMDHARAAERSNEAIQEKIFNFISLPEEMPYKNCLLLFNPDKSWHDTRSPEGIKPLYLASLGGLRYTVERLINNGAAVDELCSETTHSYALQAACQGHYVEVLRALLENGAKVDLFGGVHNCTALMSALSLSDGRVEAVKLLLDSGADPNIMGNHYDSHTHDWHETFPLHCAASNGWMGLVELLLENGADLHRTVRNGTALFSALDKGHEEVVRLLLQYGAVINKGDLAFASMRNRKGVVRMFLDQFGTTACTIDSCNEAVWFSNPGTKDGQQIIELLLNHGADLDAFGYTDRPTALERAVISRSESGCLFLLEKGATIFRMAYSGMSAGSWSLTDQENSENTDERLFRAACRKGWSSLLQLLLKRNVDPQISQGACNDGLKAASYHGFNSVVELLLSNGSHINAEPAELGDALQVASIGGHVSIVRSLLERGADANRVDKHGWSVLSIALRNDHESLSEEPSHVLVRKLLFETDSFSRFRPPFTFVADKNAAHIRIDPDECEVEAGLCYHKHQLVRADHPFAATMRRVYFEIKVLSLGEHTTIGFGVCRDEVQPGEKTVGCVTGSWGLLGNSGYFFNERPHSYQQCGPPFCGNDIVGCCVDYDANQLFFTRNRSYLGRASNAPVGRLFAAITVASGARVAFDFGASCPVAVPYGSEKDV